MRSDEWRREARKSRGARPAADRVGRPASPGLAWLSALLWIAIIQSLGGNDFSSSETSRLLGPLLLWLFPDSSTELLHSVQFGIRKAAHVVEYGILALLWHRAWRLSRGGAPWRAALARPRGRAARPFECS